MSENIHLFLIALAVGGCCGFFIIYLFPIYQKKAVLLGRIEKVSGKRSDEPWVQKSKSVSIKMQIQRLEKSLNAALKESTHKFKKMRIVFYRSGLQQNPEIFLLIYTTLFLIFSFVLIVFSKQSLLESLFLSFLLTTLIMWFVLNIRARQWEKNFLILFPQALDIITRGLRAGLTLGRGIAVVAEEIPNPVGYEFSYLAAQLQIGSSTDKALSDAADRIGLEDFRFFSIALIIQREMGGSLSEVLRKLADVIRDREKFRRKVMSLSAEAKTTAIIVSALPFLAALGIQIFNPTYMKFFITDPVGRIQGIVVIVMTLISFMVMKKMVHIES